jgi:hypothetical protein
MTEQAPASHRAGACFVDRPFVGGRAGGYSGCRFPALITVPASLASVPIST